MPAKPTPFPDSDGAMPALPSLRDTIRSHGLWATRKLGQNFILDMAITRRIARSAKLTPETHVIEIGPGPGGLTRALLELPVAGVIAVERDRRCIAALEDLVGHANGRLTVQEADALEIDAETLAPAPRAIVANLPYNIATPLLIRWLRRMDAFASLTLMFQTEVAERLVAQPDSRQYGRLSVMTQWAAHAERVMTVPAGAFVPAPKVSGTIIRLVPRIDRPAVDWSSLETVTATAFAQRRKILRRALKSLDLAQEDLDRLGIDPGVRAETLSVDTFAGLAQAWQTRHGRKGH